MFESIIEFLSAFLGEYSPVSYPVYAVADDVEVVKYIIPAGLAGVDWRFVFAGLLLLVCVYSVFRILGILIQGIGGRR